MSLISNLQFVGSARTKISLANFATSSIMNVAAYEAGEIAGWFSIVATTSYRFWFSAKFAKNGAGNDYWISPSTMGDPPPAGFNISVTPAGMIEVFLPNITGFVSANVTYALDAPAVGSEYPLTIDSSNATPATEALPGVVSTSAQNFKGVKTFIDAPVIGNASGIVAASASVPGVVTTGAQTIAGAKTFANAPVISDASGIVAASATVPGVVTTGAQTIAGAKTFSDAPVIGNASGIVAASASAAGVITTGAQTLAGVKTFSNTPVFSSGIAGITAAPTTSNIGEVRTFTSRTVTTATSGTWASNASALDTLTAGVWLVCGQANITNLTSMTGAATGIDTVTTGSGPSVGAQNWIGYNPAAAATGGDVRQMVVFRLVVPSGSTQALYAKAVTIGAVGSNCTVTGFSIRIA